jgi:hypothetical protein
VKERPRTDPPAAAATRPRRPTRIALVRRPQGETVVKWHHILAVAVALALLANVGVAEEKALKSGPQPGKSVPGPFAPLNVNGSKAGEKNCLYCSNGNNPVVMIFARNTSPELTKLLKKVEGCCDKNKDAKLGSFVVFCSDDEGLEAKLKKEVKSSKLDKVVLAIDDKAGPEGYDVNKDADVTVVLYVERKVKSNFAFKKGELKDKNIEAIEKAIPKILPEK